MTSRKRGDSEQGNFDFSGEGDRLIPPEHAAQMVGLPVRRIRLMSIAGEFPPFVKIGYRTLRYWRGDVVDWIRCRREGRKWAPVIRSPPPPDLPAGG